MVSGYFALTLMALTAYAHQYPSDEGLTCLAENIYHEARGEVDSGKLAVASVTLNRVKSKYFPDSICKVVWQPKQFSWTADSNRFKKALNDKDWKKAMMIAKLAISGAHHAVVGEATFYHADYVNPGWAQKKLLVATIGAHLFYN
ncbi:MAG: cell wall hydrolase [Arenicellales bacterium WSBS_2016_MAG_OTU3]